MNDASSSMRIKSEHVFSFKEMQGEVRVQCKCGESSPWFDQTSDQGELAEWCNEHTGLAKGRGRLSEQVVVFV